MSVISIYLIVLIAALLLGNALLALTKPRRRQGAFSQDMAKTVSPKPKPNAMGLRPAGKIFEAGLAEMQSRLKAQDQFIRMAHGRLDSLERGLREAYRKGGAGGARQKDFKVMEDSMILVGRKIKDLEAEMRKLDNFRANTLIDLKGVKEVAIDMKKNLKEKARPEEAVPAAELAEKLAELDSFKKDIASEITSFNRLAVDLKGDVNKGEYAVRLDALGKRILELNGFRQDIESDLGTIKSVVASLKSELNKANKGIGAAQTAAVKELKKEKEVFYSELDEVHSRMGKLVDFKESVEAELEALKNFSAEVKKYLEAEKKKRQLLNAKVERPGTETLDRNLEKFKKISYARKGLKEK